MKMILLVGALLFCALVSSQEVSQETVPKSSQDPGSPANPDGDEKHDQTEAAKPKSGERDQEIVDPSTGAYRMGRRWGGHFHLLSFPHPLGAGLDYQLSQHWTFAFDLGQFKFSQAGATVSFRSIGLRGRYHPWGHRFFVGAELGRHTLQAEAYAELETPELGVLEAGFEASARVIYLAPHVGWHFRYPSGFFWLIEFGARIPTGVATDLEVEILNQEITNVITSLPEYQKNVDLVDDAVNKYGRLPFPMFSFFTVGWLF